MNNIIPLVSHYQLPKMSQAALAIVSAMTAELKQFPQIPIVTHHLFHAGIYIRTVTIPKGARLTGVLIKRSTIVIVVGDAKVFSGDEVAHLTGYNLIPASAGRQQAYLALETTTISMSFATNAKTVEEAEREFTDDFGSLVSHELENEIIFTGE